MDMTPVAALKVTRETEWAYLVEFVNGDTGEVTELWLPRSVCDTDLIRGASCVTAVATWFLNTKGLSHLRGARPTV